MKTILVGKKRVFVDDDDFTSLNQHTWHIHSCGYAVRNKPCMEGRGTIYMHRVIMGAKSNEVVDHIDGNPLNNSRLNLRLCQHNGLNIRNQKRSSKNTSGFKGVSFENGVGKWRADITVSKRTKFLGHFKTALEAKAAYDAAAPIYHGEFARLC